MPSQIEPYATDYETVAASQTAQVLGGAGSPGDYLDHVLVLVATAATGTVSILDGGTTVVVFPNSPGGGIGSYDLLIKAKSVNGPWKITTGAGSSVIAVGKFTT